MANDPCKTFLEDLDKKLLEGGEDGRRPHLGGSVIGGDCKAQLWYGFRWASPSKFPARVLRIFGRGHLEEHRFVGYLKAMGQEIYKVLDDQQRISDHHGHFGGSLDGIIVNPTGFPKGRYLLEFKTYNNKRFDTLCKVGVEKSDPKYYSQAQVYLSHFPDMLGCLFFAVDKNTDEIELQLIEPNPEVAESLRNKAGEVIFSEDVPEKSPDFMRCRYCDHRDVCDEKKAPEVSCRTCRNVSCNDRGWVCDLTDEVLDVKQQKAACADYERFF